MPARLLVVFLCSFLAFQTLHSNLALRFLSLLRIPLHFYSLLSRKIISARLFLNICTVLFW